MNESPYDAIAFYYDLSHAYLVEDIPFVLGLAGDRPSRILELGCGSGRLLFPLAQAGHTVTGIDLSAAMLDLAHSKRRRLPAEINRRIHLVKGNIANFEIDQQFDLTIIPHNTLMHLGPSELIPCLKSVRSHLAAEGRLVIDIINPVLLLELEDEAEPVWEQTLIDPRNGRQVEQYGRYQIDRAALRLDLTYTFVPMDGETLSMTAAYTIRHAHQVQLACKEAGLKVETLLGNYQLEPYTEESDRLILLAALH